MNRNEDAVSPVIGVILMVAITVILAAVIAAFVFGMGPSEMAPQSSVRASAEVDNSTSVVLIEHQGGDEINLASSNTRVSIAGDVVGLDLVSDDSLTFEAGETLYLYNNGTADVLGNSTTFAAIGTPADVAASGDTINVKFIDVASQQMIADLDVRF
ncbi:type IV pilin [Methanococcoides sp. AM1]|uniref:type IV pilin n=1 Tax=Methanococcoides sp. AM1 TaxID=1201011 RepID=UPI0010828E55|nr:type IV pilin N-terminal domain-containing protein [Methanococcoides sp. AM1]